MSLIEQMQSYEGLVRNVGDTYYRIYVNADKEITDDIVPIYVIRNNPAERSCYSLIDINPKLIEQMPERAIEIIIRSADRGYQRLLKTSHDNVPPQIRTE